MNNKIKTGLSNKEVFQNRLKYGNNALNYKKKKGW